MRVYLACKFNKDPTALAQRLEQAGHTLVSKWWEDREGAKMNWEQHKKDVQACDWYIIDFRCAEFATHPFGGSIMGAAVAEFMGKKVTCILPKGASKPKTNYLAPYMTDDEDSLFALPQGKGKRYDAYVEQLKCPVHNYIDASCIFKRSQPALVGLETLQLDCLNATSYQNHGNMMIRRVLSNVPLQRLIIWHGKNQGDLVSDIPLRHQKVVQPHGYRFHEPVFLMGGSRAYHFEVVVADERDIERADVRLYIILHRPPSPDTACLTTCISTPMRVILNPGVNSVTLPRWGLPCVGFLFNVFQGNQDEPPDLRTALHTVIVAFNGGIADETYKALQASPIRDADDSKTLFVSLTDSPLTFPCATTDLSVVQQSVAIQRIDIVQLVMDVKEKVCLSIQPVCVNVFATKNECQCMMFTPSM